MRTRCLGGFSVLWLTKLLISPVKNWIFCPRTSKFGPKLAFFPLMAHLVPCWWVGWWLWRAGRGPYVARHLFTLCTTSSSTQNNSHYHDHHRHEDQYQQVPLHDDGMIIFIVINTTIMVIVNLNTIIKIYITFPGCVPNLVP